MSNIVVKKLLRGPVCALAQIPKVRMAGSDASVKDGHADALAGEALRPEVIGVEDGRDGRLGGGGGGGVRGEEG